MNLWKRDRDLLIAETLAFVQGVAAARVAPDPPAVHVSDPAPTPVDFTASVLATREIPKRSEPIATERSEITRRVAAFKAHQERFRLDREGYYNSVMARTRAVLDKDRQ